MISHAFTVRPPYSAMIAEAQALEATGVVPKLIENRSRPIAPKHFGTRIGVHAGATWSTVGQLDKRVRSAWARFAHSIDLTTANPRLAAHGDRRTGFPNPHLSIHARSDMWIPRRAVVATAVVVGCHRAGGCVVEACFPWGDLEYNGGPAWHIELADVARLREPVPAVGQIAVPWRLPADVAAAVDARFVEAVAG